VPATTSVSERAPVRPAVRRRPGRNGLAVLAALLAGGPLVLSNAYFYEVAILVAINASVCVGLNLLIGYAGQISLGHAAFFALGGYGSAVLAGAGRWPAVALVLAVAAVGLCWPGWSGDRRCA
jgi:branched-chain amino acid transport system permease protein